VPITPGFTSAEIRKLVHGYHACAAWSEGDLVAGAWDQVCPCDQVALGGVRRDPRPGSGPEAGYADDLAPEAADRAGAAARGGTRRIAGRDREAERADPGSSRRPTSALGKLSGSCIR
jgi:hypothetical protein